CAQPFENAGSLSVAEVARIRNRHYDPITRSQSGRTRLKSSTFRAGRSRSSRLPLLCQASQRPSGLNVGGESQERAKVRTSFPVAASHRVTRFGDVETNHLPSGLSKVRRPFRRRQNSSMSEVTFFPEASSKS